MEKTPWQEFGWSESEQPNKHHAKPRYRNMIWEELNMVGLIWFFTYQSHPKFAGIMDEGTLVWSQVPGIEAGSTA
jgi:hypothetical protein